MIQRAALGFSLFLMLLLAACGEVGEDKAKIEDVKPESLMLTRVEFAILPGWHLDDQEEAVVALIKSCEKILSLPDDKEIGTAGLIVKAGDWKEVCSIAQSHTIKGREFFETYFVPFASASSKTGEKGLFTGYFEAELKGSKTRSETYNNPLYAKPNDLINVNLGQFSDEFEGKHIVGQLQGNTLKPYPERGEIEAGLLREKGLELLWIDDAVDLFLLQVQGSGRVILENGDVEHVGFAAHNGRPYKSIGSALIDQGELQPGQASWDGIKGWIEKHPDKAAGLFAINPRFIFFRKIIGDGPIGAQGVALTPRRSMAVDRRYIPLGMPIWLDTVQPGGSTEPLQQLLIAQDTGGAIKGPVRGDFFWGYGARALAKAGVMKSEGRYYILLPKATAARLAVS